MNALRRCYNWIGAQVNEPYAIPLLGFVFFIESVILIPVDPLLALYCIEYPKKAWYFAAIATVASVIGGLIGYSLGALCWDVVGTKIIAYFFNPEQFDKALILCKNYQARALIIAGFLPIPYKIFTICAGFFHVPIWQFLGCSLFARAMRYFLLATVLRTYGAKIKEYIDRYFSHLVVLLIVILISLIWTFKRS
jgi:membrane protein YqaA with SNARE-associated domain